MLEHGNAYCRVVRIKEDPSRVDEAVKLYTQEILPVLKKQNGFTGATLIGNRKTGDGMSISYWESEAAMKDGRSQVRPVALNVLGRTGGSIVEDDECEVAVLERIKPPQSGVWARVTTVMGDPAQVGASIANFNEQIVPAIKMQSGVRTTFFFVNRQTGKTFAGSVWDTEQDLQRSEAPISALRAEAIKKFAGRDTKTEAFEIYFTEILAPATLVH
jgi:heme-degrading monooxygenase HmoA